MNDGTKITVWNETLKEDNANSASDIYVYLHFEGKNITHCSGKK